jgi:hypothetical protein
MPFFFKNSGDESAHIERNSLFILFMLYYKFVWSPLIINIFPEYNTSVVFVFIILILKKVKGDALDLNHG